MPQIAEATRERENTVNPDAGPESTIRRGTLVLVLVTLVATAIAPTYFEFKARSAHMAMSNLPMAVLLPFAIWLLANVVLKRVCPRYSLTSAELRVMLCALWVGAAFAGYNWVTQWVGSMGAPHYFASPENRWRELIFDYLPWWMYPSNFPGVVDSFYNGIREGDRIPWGAWMGPVFWAGSAALAMTAIGVGITSIFQKQWTQHERLTFPLAEVTEELTGGFDRERGWPPFLRSRLFWIGFAVAAVPLLWNVIAYFSPGFPRLAIFDPLGSRRTAVPRYLTWGFSYRLLPPVMGFTFLCDLNILFSLWSLHLVGQVMLYTMNRVGFSVGLSGQEAKPQEIAGIFGHGVMIGLVIWAIWASRVHLKQVIVQALRPVNRDASATVVMPARAALAAVLGGGAYMAFWLHAAGMGLFTAILWIGIFWISIFAAMKYLAASGFAYLWPAWPQGTINMWFGANSMSDATLVSSRLIGWRVLSGWRLPPALPHVARLLGPGRSTGALIFSSVMLGLLSAALFTIWLCYSEGGSSFRTWSLVGAPEGLYNSIASVVAESNRSVPDPGKITVWFLGLAAAAVATVLQARVPWWPIHPLGVMLMHEWYVSIYLLNIFLVWLAKLLVLKFGGIGLYRRAKPICYGLIVGYVFAVGCSFVVDSIWFPGGGHYIHGY